MKKIAAIFLILFALVQMGPAIIGLISDNTTVFIVDEEKGTEKSDCEKKEIKDKIIIQAESTEFSDKINIALHLAEKIHTSPCLEKETPPPNFC
jgi:hypothetical protein